MIDLTVSDITRAPVEFPLPYDSEVNESESSPYADAGSYEYTYAGNDVMSIGVPTVQRGSRVSVLCYKVISSGIKPYIMFGLCLGESGLGLIDVEFPSPDRFRQDITDIGGRFGINETLYKGYLRHGKDTILCVEDGIPEHSAQTSEIPGFQWLLSTEIMNQSRTLEEKVDPRVVGLFEAFPSLLFLYNELGNLYESPEVGYYETSGCRAASIAVLGAPRDTPSSETGPYYRFLDCEGVARQADNNSDSVVLMRFALFLGRTAMLEGSDDWSTYDSLRTPDGIVCVRDYNQQIPLGLHSIARASRV